MEANFCVHLNSHSDFFYCFSLVCGFFDYSSLYPKCSVCWESTAAAGTCKYEFTSADPCSCVFACFNFICTENAVVGPSVFHVAMGEILFATWKRDDFC